MKSSHAVCATALLSAAFMVVGSGFADATEFAVLRQRFDQNGVTFNSQSGGVATPVENLDISLNTAQAGTLQSVSSAIGIVNPDSNGLGTAATFDVFYTGAASDFPASSFFDIFTEMSVPNSVPPQDGQGTYQVSSKDDYHKATKFTVEIAGRSPQNLNMLWEINPNQVGLSFGNLTVNQPTPSSFFDIFTELQFDGLGTINPNLPLFEVTMTAETPEPSTIALAGIGFVVLMGMACKRRLQIL